MLIENIISTEISSYLKTIITLLPEKREETEKEEDPKKDSTFDTFMGLLLRLKRLKFYLKRTCIFICKIVEKVF